jgi:hypothetical protein
VNVKSLVLWLVGGGLMIMGCCAVACGGFLAWLVWGADQGSWPMQMQTLDRNLKFGMEILAVRGVGAIALGFCLRRLKSASKDRH